MPSKAWGEDFEVMLFGPEAPRAPFSLVGEYAVVDICGPLSQKPGWWTESYEEIHERMSLAFESNASAVCMKLDSPGGDCAGNLELARDIRAMAATSGKRLVAFTDGQALSAAYALATAADEIVATPSASIGSIGTWCPLVDVTAQDTMWGVKYVVASSGTAKNDRNPHTGITDEAYARLQGQIDQLAGAFFELVSEHRPALSVEAIKSLQGADLYASQGLAAGLCDRLVNSWPAFLANEEGTPMSKYDEAIGALKRAAEGADEDAKKAKKALKALEDGEKPEKTDKEKEDEAAAAKAAEDEKEKEKEDAKEAKALAVKLAGDVADLTSRLAARDAADAKAKADAELAAVFAKRPDLSEAQRAILTKIPLAEAKALVDTWPRVTAIPGAAASAQLSQGTGGERRADGTSERPLSPAEQAIFDRTDPFKRTKTSAKATFQGSEFTMPNRMITNEEAAARVAELEKEFGGV